MILAIRPGWTFEDLRNFAAANGYQALPPLLRHRYLLVDNAEGIEAPRVRKVMYFTHYYRDDRLRDFICQKIADADGRWRTNQVVNKRNAAFFEHFFEPGTAPKVRSNVEYFLIEAGIFNPSTRQVHLELEDGWLPEAVQVAAQHVHSHSLRQAMSSAPMDYLVANRLNGLANATPEELLGLTGTTGIEAEPLEDEGIQEVEAVPPQGQSWHRSPPTPQQQRAAATIADPVRRERASRAHYRLEKVTAEAARGQNHDPRYTELIDLYFGSEDRLVLCEMKSCTHANLRNQVRRGVSQLLEYRYLYRRLFGDEATLLLVLEIKPPPRLEWLIDYLMPIGVFSAWKEPGADRLVSTLEVPTSLSGVVVKVTN